jgi:hypothetical protein
MPYSINDLSMPCSKRDDNNGADMRCPFLESRGINVCDGFAQKVSSHRPVWDEMFIEGKLQQSPGSV